jgi:hypothetical protein
LWKNTKNIGLVLLLEAEFTELYLIPYPRAGIYDERGLELHSHRFEQELLSYLYCGLAIPLHPAAR